MKELTCDLSLPLISFEFLPSLPLELNRSIGTCQQKQKTTTIKAYDLSTIKKMELTTFKHICIIDINKNMGKGTNNFIDVEGRVTPNAVQSRVTNPTSVQTLVTPKTHQSNNITLLERNSNLKPTIFLYNLQIPAP